MKAIRWIVPAGIIFLISIAWIMYFYVSSLPDKRDVSKSEKNIEEAALDIQETAQAFFRALYSGKNIKTYATERAQAEVTPPGEESTSLVDIKIHNIAVYEGKVNDKAAEIIAAVNRTITVNGIATTSTQYIELQLKKEDKWRVDVVEALADIAAE
ncbi:hypothetical protein [Bacillus sp. 165]|uniref:hypothetical protein n=1 Tax=Bacillus sp. 165 TaxID=1529117 RepID=UPI001ADA48F5|nr:hypothetical protein [Bacillus sp. 165]MBO9128973.1 hypothetical protein [Bacillus sp. 165]